MYNKKKKKLPLLSKRMHTMVNWNSLASLILLGWSSVRFIVGVIDYPCDLWIWLILLTVPTNATPLVLRLVQLNFRYSFANKVRALTNSAFDEDALRRLVTMKERMEMQWSIIVGTGVVVTSILVSVPAYVSNLETRPKKFDFDPTVRWFNPSTGESGIGCGQGCGDTKLVFFVRIHENEMK